MRIVSLQCQLLHMRRGLLVLLTALSLLVLSGCSEQELYSGLSESQANDMVALLYSAGMPASKTRDSGGDFSVLTDKNSFASAVNLLHANGLPRARFENLGEVFAKEGFVSSPLEERARLNHAMSQEIAHTISSIDGVLMARVHLAVPENNELSDNVKSASASVFIKHRANVDLSGSVARIKSLVINGIENLPYDNVTVALFKAEEAVFMPGVQPQPVNGSLQASMPVSMATTLSRNANGIWLLFSSVLLLSIFGLLWWQLSSRQFAFIPKRAHKAATASSDKRADEKSSLREHSKGD